MSMPTSNLIRDADTIRKWIESCENMPQLNLSLDVVNKFITKERFTDENDLNIDIAKKLLLDYVEEQNEFIKSGYNQNTN